MTTITIFRNHDKTPVGFMTSGHAGYAEYGEDIVCAGISALVLNAINSIEAYTHAVFQLDTEEDSGKIRFMITDHADHDSALLLQSMILGLQGIENDYGKKFLKLHFKEV